MGVGLTSCWGSWACPAWRVLPGPPPLDAPLMSTVLQAAHTFLCTCTCLQGLHTCTPHVHTHARLPCVHAHTCWGCTTMSSPPPARPRPCMHIAMPAVVSTLGTHWGPSKEPVPVPTCTCVKGEALGNRSSESEKWTAGPWPHLCLLPCAGLFLPTPRARGLCV